MDEITGLPGDLKRLGYEPHIIPEFLKETHALALDAQIPKQRKQIERMLKTKNRIQEDDHMKNGKSVVRLGQQDDHIKNQQSVARISQMANGSSLKRPNYEQSVANCSSRRKLNYEQSVAGICQQELQNIIIMLVDRKSSIKQVVC